MCHSCITPRATRPNARRIHANLDDLVYYSRIISWGVPMSANSPLDDVLRGVTSDLTEIGSAMVVDGILAEPLAATIRDILANTFIRLRAPEAERSNAVSARYPATSELAEIAVAEAGAGHHPAEPLMAAEVVFDVALPIVSCHLDLVDPLRIARTLHNEIWRRIPPGATAYVEFILSKLAGAHREERLAIARELHDRVAHRLALSLQRLELAAADPADAQKHLRLAESGLRESLIDVQDLAVALRPMVGNRRLEEEVLELIDKLPLEPEVNMFTSGSSQPLAESVSEELFAIIVEAVRNSRRHACADAIDVALRWEPALLVIEIRDDGTGFAVGSSAPSGLRNMSERAQAVGARLRIESIDSGTTVHIYMPLGHVTKADS